MGATVQSGTNKKQLTEAEAATLLSHVRELQFRLLITAAVLLTAGVVAYLYYPQIIDILRKPLNAPLIISSVSGSFSFVMKICLVAGIAVSVPLIVYNFIMFVRPAFREVFTGKRVFMMTAGSVAAAAGGTLFGYFFIIPGAIHFFSGFHVSGVTSMIQADGYLNFVVNVLVTFTLMFQLPIVVSLIDRIKPIPPHAMWKGEKWALVGSIVISLVVPFAMDLMTQVLIAAPIFLLYNISFVVVVLQHKYARRVENKYAKVVKRDEARAERHAAPKKATRTTPKAPAPVLASRVPQPHPQLAEVFALQASGEPKATMKTAKPPVHAARRVAAPVKPLPVVAPTIVHSTPIVKAMPAPAVVAPTVSMDGFTTNRSQPTNVIRQSAAIKAPARPLSTAARRPATMMSDIR